MIIFFGLSACKKTEEIIIPGNAAPPDPTVSNVAKENYVNKVYISILGRKPDVPEYEQGITALEQNNLSLDNRKQLLDIVLNKPEYYQRTYEIARADLLNNIDSAEVDETIAVFTFLLTDSTYMSAWNQITYEKNRLESLQQTVNELKGGIISIIEMHRKCVNNYFYDQINMGTENFVVSMFQHFFFRYPTVSELEDGVKMVDNFSSFLFLQPGNSKDDFMTIFFDSNNYFEGQVRELYSRYLFREPTSEEMSSKAIQYKNSGSYKELQKDILSTNEYVGLN